MFCWKWKSLLAFYMFLLRYSFSKVNKHSRYRFYPKMVAFYYSIHWKTFQFCDFSILKHHALHPSSFLSSIHKFKVESVELWGQSFVDPTVFTIVNQIFIVIRFWLPENNSIMQSIRLSLPKFECKRFDQVSTP